MAAVIDKNEILYLSYYDIDRLGKTCKYKDHIFRIVKNNKRQEFENLLASQFYHELVQQKLIVPVNINNDFIYDNDHFLIESRYIPFISQPDTWSFSMLKDAAALVLKILILCEKYDYNLIDGHPWNILFDYGSPVWCDLGSFEKKADLRQPVSGTMEFLRTIYWPLSLWSKGHDYLANLILGDCNYSRLLFTEHPRICQRFRAWVTLPFRLINKILSFFVVKKLLKGDIFFYRILLKKVSRLHVSGKDTTFWSNYQSDFFDQSEENMKRFINISNLVKTHCKGISCSIDLAGNQGELTKFLLSKNLIDWGVSLDYDLGAVDRLYCFVREKKLPIYPACCNIIDYEEIECGRKKAKYKADLVLATAITHHLILTQKIPVDLIFSAIAQYSDKYVLIEFMPLGLWDGHFAPPVPDWYTEEWFHNRFSSHFKFIARQQIEPNRIVYLGELLPPNI